jgi:hypothetical protein
MLLTIPIDGRSRSQLARFHHVWVAGSQQKACADLLSGCPLIDVHGATYRDSVWAIK